MPLCQPLPLLALGLALGATCGACFGALQPVGLALAFPSRFLAYAPEAAVSVLFSWLCATDGVSRMKIFLIKTLLRGNPVLRENPP